MTIQIRVIQWEFGAAALMRNIDLSMWLRIVQRWLSHAGEIMTFRGRETALFFQYVNYCYDLAICVAEVVMAGCNGMKLLYTAFRNRGFKNEV